MKPATLSRSRASGRRTVSPLSASATSVLFCLARISRTSSSALRAGSDFVERRLERLAVPGQPGAELVEDDREALAVRQAHDVVDQVEVHGPRGLRRGQQALAGAITGVDLAQRRRRRAPRRARLRRHALDVLLADQRLRADPCRSRRRGSPGSPCRRRRGRSPAFLSSVTSSDSILPTLTPAIFTSIPGIAKPGVVEDRSHAVAAAVVAGAHAEDDQRGGGQRGPARSPAGASWPGHHDRRVAVELAVRVTPRRGAVRRRLRGGARAARDELSGSVTPGTPPPGSPPWRWLSGSGLSRFVAGS